MSRPRYHPGNLHQAPKTRALSIPLRGRDPLDLDSYAKALDYAKESFEATLVALGKDVREKVVIPACHKHRLTFMSGMGIWWFKRSGSDVGETFESTRDPEFLRLSKAAQATMKEVLALLDKETAGGDTLGEYVTDVDESCWPKKAKR